MSKQAAPDIDERVFWMALNRVYGIGAVRFQALLDHFGTAQAAWEAPKTALRAAGLPERALMNLLQMRVSIDVYALWKQLLADEITLMTWNDDEYPRRLKEIDQPPPVLYVKGEITEKDEWAVAIVGTRRYTDYGHQVAEELGAFLAHQGVTVVSGLARGIDALAHKAALDAGGRTIAVLGSGVDRIYPAENRQLAERMQEQGAVISNYAPGTSPEAKNFPPRNRLISGLSLATVVVEAANRSGALITARFANEQGREVFAVPGKIYAPQSQGTNRLIREGAHPLTRIEDLVEALNLNMVTTYQQARMVLPADKTEASLISVLGHEPLHIDEMIRQTGLPVEKVSSTLALMELKGMVRQVGGMQYVAVREMRADYDA